MQEICSMMLWSKLAFAISLQRLLLMGYCTVPRLQSWPEQNDIPMCVSLVLP